MFFSMLFIIEKNCLKLNGTLVNYGTSKDTQGLNNHGPQTMSNSFHKGDGDPAARTLLTVFPLRLK